MRPQGRGAAFGVHDKSLVDFLTSKRWFGKKAQAVRDAELVDVIPVKWAAIDTQFAVARVKVSTDEGSALYQLFLVEGSGTSDALEDAGFRRGLADAFGKGEHFEDTGVRWIVESEGKKALVVPPKVAITLSSAEQTNSSVIIDREAILKLYRRLEPGIHPDVEVTRFLTIERRFAHVPVLLGTIRFEDATGVTIAGMLQELVPGAVDGWSYALDRLKKSQPFVDDAGQLGTVTRAMHEVLASGEPGSDFDLRPATPDDVRRWAQGATRMIEQAIASLERAVTEKRLARKDVDDASAIVERRTHHLSRISRIVDEISADAGANTRTHGDYHLGQVLRSAAKQFLVIDFEGEPARPLQERRARQSPLRDVAGMLRSFAYAGAAGGGRQTAGGAEQKWEHAIRDGFLRGYFDKTSENAGLLPRVQANSTRLISLFEMEKLFYELQYELDHRPDWVWIPLRGIAELGAASRLPCPAALGSRASRP